MKFGKFNISDKPGTKKGMIPSTRLISKESSIYPVFFNEKNQARDKDEVEKIIADMDAVNRQRTESIFFGKGVKHG